MNAGNNRNPIVVSQNLLCLRCLHAQGTEEDYIRAAVTGGLSELGLSDHAPFPDHDFGLRMPYSELEEYLRSIDTLTARYSADIILYKGLEIEYLPEYCDYYEQLLTEKGLDYLLLGEHFYHERPDGDRYMYPHRAFWTKVAETDIRVIVGSDCHNPSQVWDDATDNAYACLKEYGITPLEKIIL